MSDRSPASLLGDDSPKLDSALDRNLTATIFSNIQASRKRDVKLSLRQLAAKIADTVADTKQDLPWFKAARFGNDRTQKGSLRSNANMLTFDAIEGDYDRGRMTAKEAAGKLHRAGVAALIYGTASSTPESPRWRVVSPCSMSLPPEDREALVARLNGILGGVLDGASFTMSQAFYFGGIANKPVPEIELVEGDYIDLRGDLDAGAMWKNASPVERHPDSEDGGKIDRSKKARGVAYNIRWEKEAKATKADFVRELRKDPVLAGWMKEKGQHEVDRAWEYGSQMADEDSARVVAMFFVVPDEPSDIDALNRKHAVVKTGGKTVIAHFNPNGSIDFGNVTDLHTLHANDRVVKPSSRGKIVPVSEAWLESKKRRTYSNGVTFDPSGKTGSRTLNLWIGWAVQPNPDASCKLFLKHVRNIICCGDEESINYVIGWMAHLVQHPEAKPGVALIFKGGKGAGKSIVSDYLTRMIGTRHSPIIAEANQLVGRFNAHMENALLLRVEEGFWAGDRKAEGNLKNLVTSETLAIERKGIDVIMLPSVLRIVITSNSGWIVPASSDERRWAVFNVSDSRVGDRAYFDALAAEMEGDGPAALLAYLQSYDLSEFDVRTAPQTDGLRDQKDASLRNFERFWFEALQRGALPERTEWKLIVRTDALYMDYNEFAKEDRHHAEHMSDTQIGIALSEWCSGAERKRQTTGGRKYEYHLPSLRVCRRAFDKKSGASHDWGDSDAD